MASPSRKDTGVATSGSLRTQTHLYLIVLTLALCAHRTLGRSLNYTVAEDATAMSPDHVLHEKAFLDLDKAPVLFPSIWRAFISTDKPYSEMNISRVCADHINIYAQDLKKRAAWATIMYDATGKQRSGMLEGAVTWFGSFSQCLDILHRASWSRNATYSAATTLEEEDLIRGQYCSAYFDAPTFLTRFVDSKGLPYPVPLPRVTIDLCVPHHCSEQDLTTIIRDYVHHVDLNVTLDDVNCHKPLKIQEDTGAFVSVIVILTLVGLNGVGTLFHIVRSLMYSRVVQKGVILIGMTRLGRRLSRYSSSENNNEHRPESKLTNILEEEIGEKPINTSDEKINSATENHPAPPLSPSATAATRIAHRQQSLLESVGEEEDGEDRVTYHRLAHQRSRIFKRFPSVVSNASEGLGSDTHIVKKKPGKLASLLLCFSLKRNGAKILGEGSPDYLLCLNGVRVLSIGWIIMGNTLNNYFIRPESTVNNVEASGYAQSLLFQPIINATFAADSFYILSGCLVTFVFLREKQKKLTKNPNSPVFRWKHIPLLYIHRYFRIVPCYYVTIMVYTNLLPYFGYGPRWKFVSSSVARCKDHWWANAFFFSNFYKANDMCMPWTYYLVNDFQFYLMSPLILYPLLLKPLLGFVLIFLLVCTQIISTGLLNTEINGNMLRMDNNYFAEVYVKPYCRVGVFAIGMALGYFLHKTGRKIYFRKLPLLILWSVALVVLCAVPYATYLENRKGATQWSGLQTAMYEAFSRPAWGLALSWVIFACSIGQGGFFQKLLSWNAFLPLCRITYGAYLLHPIMIAVVVESKRHLYYISPGGLIYTYIANFTISYGVAFLLIVFVERPFIGLEKIIRGR